MSITPPFGLFLDSADLKLEKIILEPNAVTFRLQALAETTACPNCEGLSSRIHSRYRRVLADLPAHGGAIRLELHVRKFFCSSAECPRRIFTERLPTLVASRARTTSRLHGAHRDIGLALGGEAGSRLAATLAMATSSDTLLRRVREVPVGKRPAVRVLGVDDWAFRKGHTYGTILCDLERRCPIDLLPVRSAEALCAWLKDHPEVEIISRDRGDEMIRGATAGAPQATQVADRWHLLRNLRDALVGTVDRHRTGVRTAAQQVAADPPSTASHSTIPSQPLPGQDLADRQPDGKSSASRARRLGLYEQIQQLHRQGQSECVIAKHLGLHKETVRHYRAADAFPERAERCYERGTDSFVAYLKQRWSEGCRNATRLFEEIQARGFIGSYYMVRRQLAVWRKRDSSAAIGSAGAFPSSVPVGKLSSRRVTSLLLRADTEHQPEERAFLERLQDGCPEVKAATEVARAFATMVRERQEASWDDWLTRATAPGGVKELRTFADGLKRDEAAVRAALRLPWSNGQVEGAVNRLKTLKRQMYGRANFDLLRQRVLLAA